MWYPVVIHATDGTALAGDVKTVRRKTTVIFFFLVGGGAAKGRVAGDGDHVTSGIGDDICAGPVNNSDGVVDAILRGCFSLSRAEHFLDSLQIQ